jgi:hypothetical protein
MVIWFIVKQVNQKNGDFGSETKDYTTNKGLPFKNQQLKWWF